MVIVLPDGTVVVEDGDPSFASVEDLGANAPTNYVLDPDPNRPVSQFILETFGIPFSPNPEQGRVLGGSLPGYDIRNQDATTMMKLSLVVELRDPPGGSSPDPAGVNEFAEVELDEFGVARFYIVGAIAATDLDIRYCIPTSQLRAPADLVIVRGYDPPPRRELRTSFDGLKNAEIFTYGECAAGSCDENAVGKFASISYDDPLLDQVYLDDVVNSYEIQAFESIIGYVVDLDLPDGTDPDFAQDRGIKITFGDTTKEYITIDSALLNNFLQVGNTSPSQAFSSASGFLAGQLGGASGQAKYGNTANNNSTTLSISSVDPQTGECSTEVTSIVGSKIIIPASRFIRTNKFGKEESDFIGVQEIVFSGRKVVQINSFGDIFVTVYVKPQKELISLQQGKNWTWTVLPNGDIEIELFSVLEDEFAADIADLYANPPGAPTGLFRRSTSSPNQNEVTGPNAFEGLICNIGDRLGYLAVNNTLCVVVERKRPSIDVFDPNGNAEDIALKFLELTPADAESIVFQNGQAISGQRRLYGIRYTPIVMVDEPAPIAYAATAPLQSIDAQTGQPGAVVLPAAGVIDQTDGIVDADPSTTQDFGESQLQVLQDNTNGATIDISLPFCTETECLQIAQNFLSLQSQIVDTQSIVLGPDSVPRLGDVLPDGSIINEINYSYSDASQYLITVTAGPKYLTAGSFQDSKYQLATEDVTREGMVVQDAGNGAEYIVRVDGFGELNCLSMVLDEITAGDRVQVRIYNNPQEHF